MPGNNTEIKKTDFPPKLLMINGGVKVKLSAF
jgi:hypothetical protein